MCWLIALAGIKYIYRPLSVPDLKNVLQTLQDKLSALVYCQRDRTPDTFDSLKELEKSNSIQVFGNVKDTFSVRDQNNSDLLRHFKALHQSSEIELKTMIYFCGGKVIFPQIPLKANQNYLVSVPQTLKRTPLPLL